MTIARKKLLFEELSSNDYIKYLYKANHLITKGYYMGDYETLAKKIYEGEKNENN